MDQPKIERLLQIMQLLSSNTNYSLEEIEKAVGISERTLYRYIDSFKKAGFAVTRPEEGVYKLATLQQDMLDISQLVYFSKEESIVISKLIDSLDKNNSVKSAIRRKLSAVCEATPLAACYSNKKIGALTETLTVAVREHKQAILRGYESASSNTIQDYYIEPYAFTGNYEDIWAYDIKADMNKTFKVSRMGDVEVGDSWTHEDKHAPRPVDSFRMSGSTPLDHVKLKLTTRAKTLLVEEFPVTMIEVEQKGRNWYWEGDINKFEGIGRFVLGLHREVVVMEGEKFKEWLAGEAKSIGKKYGE